MICTKRKFLDLEPKQRHKKCAELLRVYYDEKRTDFSEYNTLLSWLKFLPYQHTDLKALADRYHWHLQMAGQSLKEYHLLPSQRSGEHTPKLPFANVAIYLDHVRSPYNVGNILRTVEGLRIGKVYFSEKTPFIDHEKVERTALGAAQIVPCFRNIPLADLPRPIIALDPSDAALPVGNFEFPEEFTLVLGNEEYGISAESLKEVDQIVEIPLYGAKNSLNIGSAFAIAAAQILACRVKSTPLSFQQKSQIHPQAEEPAPSEIDESP